MQKKLHISLRIHPFIPLFARRTVETFLILGSEVLRIEKKQHPRNVFYCKLGIISQQFPAFVQTYQENAGFD